MMLGAAPPQEATRWDGDQKYPFIEGRFTLAVYCEAEHADGDALERVHEGGHGDFGRSRTRRQMWSVSR
jgi:hypothetical protein